MHTTRQRLVTSVIATVSLAALLAVGHQQPSRSATTLAASIDAPRTFMQRASRSHVLPDGGREVPTTSTTVPTPPITLGVKPKPKPRTVVHAKGPAATPQAPSAGTSGLPAGLVCIGNNEQGKAGYATNTGNGFTGRYQYTHSTWNHYGGYSDAYLAPPSIQDERALADYNLGPAHRHQEWPRSSRFCGV